MKNRMIKQSTFTLGALILMSGATSHAFTAYNTAADTTKTTTSYTHLIGNSASEQEAQAFITNVTKEGISFLEDKSLNEDQKKSKFRKFLKENFDLITIGRFALGKYWRTSTKEQKKEYLNLFENMIVDVYSRRFGEYDNQNIEVTKTRPEGKADMLVNSKIVQNSGPEVALDWRVRKKKSGELKVIDISVEGISMSLTQRSDFAAVIQRGGGNVDVLLDHLQKSK